MTAIVVVTPEELAELVRAAVREELGKGVPCGNTLSPLLSKQALAAQLGISVAGVDRLVRDGRIPFVRVGDVKRFDGAAVRAALEHEPTKPAVNVDARVRLLSRGSR